MRPPCTFCARKHLAQALVLLQEARQGYPLHRWYAIGHLAEAADELIADERDRVRDVAHAIRQERKRLEADELHEVPVPRFIQELCDAEGEQQPGTTPSPEVLNPSGEQPEMRHAALGQPIPFEMERPVAIGALAETATAAPCSPCEEAKRQRAASLAAANAGIIAKEVQASKDAKRPRLMLLTTLADFNPSYSLSTVILDQAHAGIMAGFDVDVLMMEHSNTSMLHSLPPGMALRQVVPAFEWKEDVVDLEVSQKLSALMVAWSKQYAPDLIITHDLIHQRWFATFAHALHHVVASGHVLARQVMHMAHSAPGVGFSPAPHMSAEWFRRTIPPGQYLLTCNAELVDSFSRYYACGVDRIRVLTNARDVRAWMNVPPLASEIITFLQLHRTDIVQVYPFSVTRWREKGVEQLLRSFALIRELSAEHSFTVKLVLVTCHADGKGEEHVQSLRNMIASVGVADVVVITSDAWPQTKQVGLAGDVVQALFSVSNLFLFPTWSEAASLILREAALAGCSLVLNETVAQLRGCIPFERARWYPWRSLHASPHPNPEAERALLAEVVTELLVPSPSSLKRYAMAQFCLEAMGETLRSFLAEPGLTEQPPS